ELHTHELYAAMRRYSSSGVPYMLNAIASGVLYMPNAIAAMRRIASLQ
ncbi:10286_t:CDS:1, partial [Ambispora leptoticha]